MGQAQIVKWGNSLAVRIPKPLAEQAGFQEGDSIRIEASHGQIDLRPAERIPTLRELVNQIKPAQRYEETSAGPIRGKEAEEW